MNEPVKKILAVFLLSAIALAGFPQLKPVYNFWTDDSLVKKRYYEQALKNKEDLVASLDKDQKKDYKEIYESRFVEVGSLLKSNRTVTEPAAHQYLQSILKKIIDVNPELNALPLRIVFTRDWWPNAYSMGEGTIAFNAGLFVYLNNEAEIAFVLCHELAHYFLNHSKKRIDKQIKVFSSDSLKNELKRLSKLEYNERRAEAKKLSRFLAFDMQRHSREGEEEADRVGLRFLKRTGYTGSGFISSMEVMDNIDDTSLFNPLNLSKILTFPGYPFKERWIKKESVIFGAMKAEDASTLTKAERDSLKTHPDCTQRIALLGDSALALKGAIFQVDEKLFQQLKQDFLPEMLEQVYRDGNYSFNLYLALQMLQDGKHTPLAVYSIVRDLNNIYKRQKEHRLGMYIDSESRAFEEEYNQLLRMLYRLRLSEIAALSDNICSLYQEQMKEYDGFGEEMEKAKKNKQEQQ